ncbi:MAG: NAD(P)/FAD-dependent oxidoreductase [Candidatus Bathyarchaeota archaeon]
MEKYDYDVIIAGGGLSSLLTATAIGIYSKQNAKILVIDRNSSSEPGKKTINGWTCGDATSKRSIDFLLENTGISYNKPELEHPVEGILLFSPDHKTRILFEGQGFVLNRKVLGQRQVTDAKKVGVEIMFNTLCTGLYNDDQYVRGVVCRNPVDNKIFQKTAKMVIDATGITSILRPNLSIDSKIEKEVDRDNLESVGRYIFNFEEGEEDQTWFDQKYGIIHLDQYLAPGGYGWTFPKGNNKVNVGLGVQKKALDKRNQTYGKKDTLQDLVDNYVKNNKAIKNPIQSTDENDRGNTKGFWPVSVRRHNDCLVANGFAIVGDAAWMPRPIDAGGISPSIYASVILGKVVANALEGNDVSETGLWQYNVDYMRLYGYQMASFEILRKYLQTLTNNQISYGMKHYLSEDDIQNIVRREHPKFNKVKMFSPHLWFRILREPSLARGLKFISDLSERLITLNLAYPEKPNGFKVWRKQLLDEITKASRLYIT